MTVLGKMRYFLGLEVLQKILWCFSQSKEVCFGGAEMIWTGKK